jgi:hypothetical protein
MNCFRVGPISFTTESTIWALVRDVGIVYRQFKIKKINNKIRWELTPNKISFYKSINQYLTRSFTNALKTSFLSNSLF